MNCEEKGGIPISTTEDIRASPASGAIFAKENRKIVITDTFLTREKAESLPEPMKYPVLLRPRKNGPVLARIYRPAKAYPLYRLAWSVGGKRMMKAFPTYSAAKCHGEELVPDLAKGSQSTLLTPS